jgi:hypothetical protein
VQGSEEGQGSVAITYGDLGRTGASGWSEGFRPSDLTPFVIEVAPPQRAPVLEWAERQPVPRAARRQLHTPSVDAWAVLDGGVVHVYGYGLTSLPAGLYIVGPQAFQLILTELGLPRPDDVVMGAVTIDAADLLRRHRAGTLDDPSAVEQADLLAGCTDSVMLRWVAATLVVENGAATPP